MSGVRVLLLLTVWSLGIFLPGVPGDAAVHPWLLPPTGYTSPPALPDRARPHIANVRSGLHSLRAAIARDHSRTSAVGGRSRLAGGLAGRRVPPIRIAAASTAGTVLDVRYVDQVYAQRRLECFSGHVCVWNDCGPASAAMVLHYEGMETRDVLTNRQATLDLVCETKPGCKGTTNRDRMLATLQNHGLDAYLVDTPSLAEIQASIDLGHPVILSLTPWPDHVIVAVGYKPGDLVVIHDPYGGAFWWRHMRNINEPVTGHPKRNGEGIEYKYADLKPLIVYGLFTAGPATKAGPAGIVPPLSE